MKKTRTKEEIVNRKRNIKGAIIFVLIIGTIFPIVWYARIYFAEESMIDYRTTEIKGDTLSVIFSEKTSSPHRGLRSADDHSVQELNDSHYGYFLELYDSAAHKSLDKIEFESPVWEIQNTPELRVFPNGIIWLISTSQDVVFDEPGFILKFEIKNQKIIQSDFKLDEKYRIRDIEKNWVIITDGNTIDGMHYDPFFGCTYLDLETQEIVVVEAY